MTSIKMVDLSGQYRRIKLEINEAIQSVLDSTAFIQGPPVAAFSEALGKYVNSKFTIPCANGTDALQIAMMALDLKPGDEVLLPVHTYVATAEVIALLRLKPVFVDVNEADFNLDATQLRKRITSRTKAIVPVHLYGQCADMEPILQLAHEHGLYVIEDAAQALGGHYQFTNGSKAAAGTMGTIGTSSFFPSKNLGCYGDGGVVFTQDDKLAEQIKMIANHGQKKKYFHDIIGINSRLDTLQAAILNVKLKYLNDYTDRRNSVASYYDQRFSSIEWITIPARVSNSTHVFHQYTLKINGRDRNDFEKFLRDRGIPTMIYYPLPLHLQKAYQSPEWPEGSFPVSEKLSRTVISMPIHTELDEEQLQYICEIVKSY
jgi:UDP-2-acetamido-2-deoxy-ribo-hexuluronate aminotransferase